MKRFPGGIVCTGRLASEGVGVIRFCRYNIWMSVYMDYHSVWMHGHCKNMRESLWWTPKVSIINVKRILFKKVMKNWLRLIEAAMASMRVFREKYFGVQHSKIHVQYMYIPNYDNDYFWQLYHDQILIKCNCFVYRSTPSQMDVNIH